MADADSFFSRWSRRKAAVAQGQTGADPTLVSAVPHLTPLAPPLVPPLVPSTHSTPAPNSKPVSQAESVPQARPQTPSPAPTLEDVNALTLQSDFSPFMASNVAPAVKNAAMKKLFSDPHFNVMDRLDIYIDDYSQPDPLPTSLLRKMASAKFLNLFDEEVAVDRSKSVAESVSAGEDANTQVVSILPESASSSDCFMPTPPALAHPLNLTETHAHADLRLQPHDSTLDTEVAPPTGTSGEREPDFAQHPLPP